MLVQALSRLGDPPLRVRVTGSAGMGLAERLELEVIGPYLLGLAIVMFLLHESFVQRGKRRST